MKKTFLIVVLAVAALAALSTGVAYAQGFGGGQSPITNGEGPLHDYMIKAYAEALSLTPDALEARIDKGETVYQIALAQGIAADQIPTVLAAARAKALDAAVSAGVISADQAAWMKSRMGQGFGNCDGAGRLGGGGMRGRGASGYGSGMMRGGGWQQTNP
jgi:hypothetical protein